MEQDAGKKGKHSLALNLLDEMDTIVYVCDVETQELLYANKSAVQQSRMKGDYHGCTCYNYMYGRDKICRDCQLRQLTEGGHQELVHHDEVGGRYLNIDKKGVMWEGRLACAHFINDVTNKKHSEKALAAEKEAEAKAAFASSVSHDMRTPLNGILGFTELAIDTEHGEQREAYLQKIQQTGRFMLSLINDTLDFSKLEAGGFQLEPHEIDIHDMLDGVLTPIRENADRKGVQFLEEAGNCHFGRVRVDALKLQKIILNLLSNAVKYTPEGGKVTLAVEGPGEYEGGANCHICVHDTGMGMSKDFLPTLFQPFAQAKIKRPRGEQGTGLGMAIVKKLVDLLEGQILVESELGRGTRIDVYLTLEECGKAQRKVVSKSKVSRSLAGKKVLLAEDNELNRELLQHLLAARGLEVVAVEDGQQAVAAYAESGKAEYAAVLLDMFMPVMNGCEAARAIRAMSRGDAQSVPIVALSGATEEQDLKDSAEAGMNAHLPKPIEINTLMARLEEFVKE